jgi:hypothetical protein
MKEKHDSTKLNVVFDEILVCYYNVASQVIENKSFYVELELYFERSNEYYYRKIFN